MRIGLVHNWPGSKNSELDLIGRIISVLSNLGHEAAVLDPFGKLLDPQTGKHTQNAKSGESDFDFVLYLHYLNPKLVDAYSYIVNWNPLHYLIFDPSTGEPLRYGHIEFVRNSMLSHDYILSASSSLIDDFQYAQFGETRWAPAMGDLKLHTSCQVFDNIPPVNLGNFKVFYIGANWEKVVKAKNPHIKFRHEGLLESLDATGDFVFYGIRSQHGVDLWDGFQYYKGELPFDAGASIVETCNRCGVALVLSSDAHRDSAVVSTRIFQACAARCVIITDNNTFIKDHFGDSVLSFVYDEDSDRTAKNILEKVEWIKQYPLEAKEKAEKAHRIFKEQFSLDAEVGRIVFHHENNLKRLDTRYEKVTDTKVDVYFNCSVEQLDHIAAFFDQLAIMKYVIIRGILMIPYDQLGEVETVWKDCAQSHPSFTCKIIAVNAYSKEPNGSIFHQVFSDHSTGDFFALWNPNIHWHSEHLANLVLECLDSGNQVAQSATYVSNEWFDHHAADAYYSMYSINAVKRLEFMELMTLDRSKVEFSSFVFSTKLLYQDWNNMLLLKYLDDLYPFIFLLSNFTHQRVLPGYVPKYTCTHTMDKGIIDCDAYYYPWEEHFYLTYRDRSKFYSATQQVAFIQGAFSSNRRFFLAYSMAKSIHDGGAGAQAGTNADASGGGNFSLNQYMQSVLVNRQILLKSWNKLFALMVRLLKLN